MTIKATYQLAMAASLDAGNRSMKKAGRAKWSQKDIEAAEKAFHQVMGTTPERKPLANQSRPMVS